MSGLEALSLACNVMQLISFTLETVKLFRNIGDSGSSDKDLKENTGRIKQTFDSVQQMLLQQPTAPTDAESRLRDLAGHCIQYAKDIEKELEAISPKKPGRLSAFKSTVKTKWRRPDIEKLQSRLEAAQKTMDSALNAQILDECMRSKALNHSTYATLDQQQKDFFTSYKKIDDLLTTFKTAEDTQAYEKLLKSLKYAEMNYRKTSVPQRHDNTFEWIFQDGGSAADDDTGQTTGSAGNASLVKWLQEGRHCLFWVSGKPGSGKSTFMKFIENDNRTRKALEKWHPRVNIISHFLWKPGTQHQRSLKGLLCSLLYQVLCHERAIAIRLLRGISALKFKSDVSDWDMDEVMKLLFEVFQSSSCAYLVFLDGLDELAKPHEGLGTLFGLFDALVAADRVKLCVSSRPERLFVDNLGSNPAIRMQDLTHGDIWNYTTNFLGALKLQPDKYLHQKITMEISDKAEGVFIWVYVVLHDVKAGIDIYERIIKLPPDLMDLYKDMWSRLEGCNEKYIKKAARYFQFVRDQRFSPAGCNIAMLALVADDTILERFTTLDEIISVEKWVRMCQPTFETLLPVSAGLLEVHKRSIKPYKPPSDDDRKIIVWEEMRVSLIHRTANDFLYSDEGKRLFERYTLGSEDFLSISVKAQLIRRSVLNYHPPSLRHVWKPMWEFENLESNESVTRTRHDLLSLVHRSAVNETRPLVRPPSGISYQNFFLAEASYCMFYDYVAEWLESSGNYDLPASIYVLIGACDYKKQVGRDPDKRYRLIRDILQRYVQFDKRNLELPAIQDIFNGIMVAWRCFLLHELSFHKKSISKQTIEEVLESFIKAGVMVESPGPRYLIAVQGAYLSMRRKRLIMAENVFREPRGSTSVVYTEVNDAFLLQQLSKSTATTSELISIKEQGAFMKPVLAHNGVELSGRARFFDITTNENGQEASATWIFGGDVNSFKGLFPCNQPSYLQAANLGEFLNPSDALKEIGYDLPAVNRSYNCLHSHFDRLRTGSVYWRPLRPQARQALQASM